jgi:hypothetical protein
MRKGQIFRAEDNSQLRIEEITEVYYPFGDSSNFVRAKLIVTIGGQLKEEKEK